jgi:hypothetical protein
MVAFLPTTKGYLSLAIANFRRFFHGSASAKTAAKYRQEA